MQTTVLKKYENSLLELKEQLTLRLKAINLDKTCSKGPLHPDFQEQSQELQNNEVLDKIDDIDTNELQLINKALGKIKQGQFGACEQCSEPITEKRLNALPFADKCIQCS